MDELQSKYIKKIVEEAMKQNTENITELIMTGLTDSMNIESMLPIMIKNSISISSQLAIQAVIEILCQAEVVKVDEELLRRVSLTVVKK